MHLYVDLNPAVASYQNALKVPKAFSRYSFTIYILHHIVHVWPLWVYATATGQEPTAVWMKAMPLTASIPLAVLFLFCVYGLVRVLGDDRNYGIEACMRWLCD
jgi:peptidoglycan/LPS O-acetylase OafA/YrhL